MEEVREGGGGGGGGEKALNKQINTAVTGGGCRSLSPAAHTRSQRPWKVDDQSWWSLGGAGVCLQA